jgi:uncharacterized protein (TIGR03083 family)
MAVVGDPPGDLPRLFGLERERLLELLTSLEPTDWYRETPCPGWSVLGLASHLVNGELGELSRHRDDFVGTWPPDGNDEFEFIEWIDNLHQEWVWATRGLSPRIAMSLLAWSGPQMVDHFAAQDPMERMAYVGPRTLPQLVEPSSGPSLGHSHKGIVIRKHLRPGCLRQ